MQRPSPVQESVLQTIADRLANTSQVLQSWCAAVEQAGELSEGLAERLALAAAQIESACEALNSGKSAGGASPRERRGKTERASHGLRGRSEMISLVDFIGFLATLGKDGVLHIQSAQETFTLQLEQGAISYVHGSDPPPGKRLGEILVAEGALEQAVLDEAIGHDVPEDVIGRTLLREGKVDERSLKKALATQAVQIFYRMHRVGTGFAFQFEEGVRELDDDLLRMGVPHLLLESARMLDEQERERAEAPPAPLPAPARSAGRARSRTADGPSTSAGDVLPEVPDPRLESFRALLEQRVDAGQVTLPTLPSSTGKLLAMCAQGEDAEHIAEVVRNDQALSSHILRVANSAAYAPVDEVTSIQLAVSRLGLDTIRELTFALTLKQSVFMVPGWNAVIMTMWKSAAIAGCFSRELCRQLAPDITDGTLIGLLCDVGEPIVLHALLEIAEDSGMELDKAVAAELLARYHAPLGCLLVREWSLPECLESVCLHHEDYTYALSHRREAKIANLAHILAAWAEGNGAWDLESLSALPVVSDLDISREQLEALMDERDRILEQAEVFA